MITYKKASLNDIAAMQELIKPEVDAGIILPRSNDEIATNIRSYMLAFDEEKLVGFCALHVHSPALAEIRSLIIREEYRSKGIGSKIVKRCLEEAKGLGLKQVLSLTYKQSFFEKLGFMEIPKESLPDHKIWADCIKCKHFPVCNEISLIKNI
ncbi:N-acetyltransferase [Sulfurimonas sp. HSL-1716]|uniref:N-acetyltransferase n=1 Tax=Hydrocurvibacter sulfurireducens TaxID=3131937 RepID=UPI0031F75D7A